MTQAEGEWHIKMLLPGKQSEEQAKPKDHQPRSQETPVSMETESWHRQSGWEWCRMKSEKIHNSYIHYKETNEYKAQWLACSYEWIKKNNWDEAGINQSV